MPDSDIPHPVPVDGTLDLHTFRPAEIRDLAQAYLDECARRGIQHVRIIHGKGKGVQRRIIQSLLASHPAVESFGPEETGNWGATTVVLRSSAKG